MTKTYAFLTQAFPARMSLWITCSHHVSANLGTILGTVSPHSSKGKSVGKHSIDWCPNPMFVDLKLAAISSILDVVGAAFSRDLIFKPTSNI
jgi:hypothetical protein